LEPDFGCWWSNQIAPHQENHFHGTEIAARTFRRADELFPEDEATLAGLIFEKMGDYRSAIECYREAFSLPREKDRTWYFLHNNLGYCLNQLGRHDEAEKMCRAAIEIDPGSYNAYKNLGVALQGQGIYPEAAVLFLRAAFAFPPDPRSIGHLEDLLSNHREEVEREIPDIADHLAAAIDARQKLMQ